MEQRKSKLSAIMFTDIVGYSRLMNEDENNALDLLDQHNKILFPLIEEFDGRIVKTMGDALLVDFNSALSAANCAMNVQRALANYNRDQAPQQQILLRIGIHMGDVWYNDDDVFGDSVNIAARLEPYALPGGIALSRDMYQLLANKSNLEFLKLGTKDLENINKQIDVYHLRTGCEVENTSQKESQMKSDHITGQGSQKKQDDYQDWEKNPGEMLKNKVFKALNSFMDQAVDEWDKHSNRKKKHYVKKMKTSSWFDHWDELEHKKMKFFEQQHLAKMRIREERQISRARKKNSLGMGIVSTIGFGLALAITNSSFLIFPFVFLGVIPLISGVFTSIRNRRMAFMEQGDVKLNKKEKEKGIEKVILQLARQNKGYLTVLEVANETDLSIEESKAALDQMASKGYVEINVSDSGLVRYEFPDFAQSHKNDEDYLADEIDKLERESLDRD